MFNKLMCLIVIFSGMNLYAMEKMATIYVDNFHTYIRYTIHFNNGSIVHLREIRCGENAGKVECRRLEVNETGHYDSVVELQDDRLFGLLEKLIRQDKAKL